GPAAERDASTLYEPQQRGQQRGRRAHSLGGVYPWLAREVTEVPACLRQDDAERRGVVWVQYRVEHGLEPARCHQGVAVCVGPAGPVVSGCHHSAPGVASAVLVERGGVGEEIGRAAGRER